MRPFPFGGTLIFVIASVCLPGLGCVDDPRQKDTPSPLDAPATPLIPWSVTAYHPHDTSLFTEGLLFRVGKLFESTGSPENLPHTRSMIGISDLQTGRFERKIELDRSRYFGEGIVFLRNRLYQLTYLNQTGFIYDAGTYKLLDSFKYKNIEGWSLTTDGEQLIMSDGTGNLTFLDPDHLNNPRSLAVTENGQPVDKLNELEYIRGFIYANVWTTNEIVKIDPRSGLVAGRLNLVSLAIEARSKNSKVDVLNGIAYDPVSGKVYVTGKFWKDLYEISFAF